MDYCRICKKKTKSFGVPIFVQVKRWWRRLSTCRICKYNKNNVSKSPDYIESIELFKPSRKRYKTRHFIQKGMDDTWDADYYEFYRPKGKIEDPSYNFRHERKYANENDFKKLSQLNYGYKGCFNFIDTFSKYVWSAPAKTKSANEQTAAFLKVIKESGRCPKKLHVDRGGEFYNKTFKKVLEKLGVEIYSTGSDKKASIIERFNRTLGDKFKPIIYRGLSWVEALPNIISTYNNTYHRTIKMKPIEVTKDKEAQLLSTVYNYRLSTSSPKFEIGDRVRLSSHSYTFKNKLKPKWTKEIFTVAEVIRSNVIYYKLEDITDTVYEEELQSTLL